ncbi:Ig-like domain-containing protein, partial [Rhizobium rhizoryzae]|uniref:Ig-like domain-containing protein n=1 Tax=Rhizobium rhizoryzae TaxID=451876 RepID=UPI00289B2B26
MTSIQGIYLSLFGRPADPSGLAYFSNITKDGRDLSAIGNLAGTAEYQVRFSGMTNEQVVNSIYESLFGRPGEAEGIGYWVKQIQAGRFTINNIAIAILDGAQGSDLATVNAKISAANLFTARLDLPSEVSAYIGSGAATIAREFISTINKDNASTIASVDAAILKIVSLAGQGSAGGNDTSGGTVQPTISNNAPSAANVSSSTDEDNPVSIAPAARDVDGDTLSFGIEAGKGPSHGSVIFNAQTGKFDYTPAKDFFGSDSFTYTVSDGKGGTTSATASITIKPVNDAPTATDLSVTIDEDNPVSIAPVARDVDGDTLSFGIEAGKGPSHGSVIFNAQTGKFDYTPAKDFFGSDSFTYTVSDGKGGTTSATASITINPINDAPALSDMTASTDEDNSVSFKLLAVDPEGDLLNFTIAGGVDHGSLLLNTLNGEST